MPVESAGYRSWPGKQSGLVSRVLSIARCDIRYKLKRPATIVILVLLGLYTLLAGLPPIMANLFGGENIFLDDPTPHYSRTVVPQITLNGAQVLDGDIIETYYGVSDDLFDFPLSPGKTVRFLVDIKNTGSGSGAITVGLGPSPVSGRPSQWQYELIDLEGGEGSRSDFNISSGSQMSPTRSDDEPSEDIWEPDDRNPVFYDEILLQAKELEMSRGEEHSMALVVSLDEKASFDTLAVIISVEAYNDEDYRGGDDWLEPAYYHTSMRFDVFTDINVSQEALKGLFEVELIGVETAGDSWSTGEIEDIYEKSPAVKWDRELQYTLRFTNKASVPIFIHLDKSHVGLSDTLAPLIEGLDENVSIYLGPGGMDERTLRINPLSNVVPSHNYLHIVIIADDDGLDFDRDVVDGYSTSNPGQNQTLYVVPIRIESRQYPVDDSTADYFFNVFYMGGINIWVIFFVIIVGAGFIADDRANKTLPLYYSKAIPKIGYVIGKFTGLSFMMVLVTAIWSTIWFSFIMILGGFSWDFFVNHLWVMGALALYGLLISFVLSAMILALSSLAKNRYFVGATFVAIFLILSLISTILKEIADSSYYLLLSISHNLLYVGNTLFDLGEPPVDWWYSFLVLSGIVCISAGILYIQLMAREVDNK